MQCLEMNAGGHRLTDHACAATRGQICINIQHEHTRCEVGASLGLVVLLRHLSRSVQSAGGSKHTIHKGYIQTMHRENAGVSWILHCLEASCLRAG